jgi:transcriptional regulator with XRE-family HTH domain
MKAPHSINAESGRKLRALRLRAHLSMRELARRAGVAVSYVSKLEAGGLSATLATLRKLLVALGSDLGPFFDAEQAVTEGWIFRRPLMHTTADAGRSYTFLLPTRSDIQFNMLDEELFAGEQPEFETLEGDLAGYVLAGELRLELAGERPQVLRPGDAFYVPAGRPARGRCGAGKSVRLVSVFLRSRHPRLPRQGEGSQADLKGPSQPKSGPQISKRKVGTPKK